MLRAFTCLAPIIDGSICDFELKRLRTHFGVVVNCQNASKYKEGINMT